MSSFQSVGVIGVGNMGRAIIAGMVSGDDAPDEIFAYDINTPALKDVSVEYAVEAVEGIDALASHSDLLILAVKPNVVPDVLRQIEGDSIHVVSIAAGVSLGTLGTNLPDDAEYIRVMPNTPAQIGEGMTFLAPGKTAGDDFVETARNIFECVGETAVVKEEKMDAVTALSGSGPAYLFYFLEALEEAGVYMGLDGDVARKAAEQTVYGSVALAREREDTGPAELRAEVSSPGGTTVEAIKYFDEKGMKGIMEEALKRARDKSIELGEG